jgi:hypothetical protein
MHYGMAEVTAEEILSIAQRFCGGVQQQLLYLLGRADVIRYQQYDSVIADARVASDLVDGGLRNRSHCACACTYAPHR